MVYREYKYLDGAMFDEFVSSGAAKLEKNVKKINDLNVFPIPDGDTGDNMLKTLSGGIKRMKEVDENSVAKKAKALAEGMLFNARGNSGVILSQIFSGIAQGFSEVEVASIDDILVAFNEGVKKAYKSVNPPVEGTILTVARESVEEFSDGSDLTIGEFAQELSEKMYKSLENTPELLSVLKEAGVIDSGGAGLYLICEGAVDAINGEAENLENSFEEKSQEVDFSKFTEDSTLIYGYCTEFLLRLMNKKVDIESFDVNEVVKYLETIGDSIVAFKDGSILKVHVHTMTPAKVIEYAQNFGEFLTIKIENMTLQHNETRFKENDLPVVKKGKTKYASIVVSSGEGFKELFKELGASCIIEGGQGHNPSTNDFIEAFDEVNAENVFVFPNNSNIILAATQAKEIYNDANIYVLPTKNIGDAYSALSMLDYSYDDPNDVYNLFLESINSNTTALICKATRDVTLNGVDVKLDDYIAIVGKEVVSSKKELKETVRSLFNKYDDKEIITIFYGKMMDDNKKKMIKELIDNDFSGLEVYEMDGGQDTFDLIIIME